jgi:hypothetical protein
VTATPPSTEPQGVPRCTAAAVAGILRDVISRPHRLVLFTDAPPPGTGSVWAEFGVWRLLLSWVNGQLTVQRASCPEALRPCTWSWGCERDDWTLGPGSRVIEPVALLTPAERERLVEAIAAAEVEPSVGGYDMGPSLEVVADKRAKKPAKELKWRSPWPEAG